MLLLSLLLSLLVAVTTAHYPELYLGLTRLKGRSTPNLGVDFFGGIPYAESPVGPLRFRPPIVKPLLPLLSFDASHFGRSCLQPPIFVNVTDQSEDCLTINIVRPSNIAKNVKLPVLFWTYGGKWSFGTSSIYDGRNLVARSISRGTPVIFVSFNYRVGPLGFPQGQESENHGILNLGIRDQVAALKWVQYNIHYFGGDRTKVTVSGESAGSVSTAILYLNNHLDGLARAAIFQSGQANTALNPKAAFREEAWQRFVQNIPACATTARSGTSLHCLQFAPASHIHASWMQLEANSTELINFGPTVDPSPNSVVSDFPSRHYARGRFSKIPFISGTNLDEGTLFALRTPGTTEADIKREVIKLISPTTATQEALHDAIDQVLGLYPDVPELGSPFGTGNELFGLPSAYKRHAAILNDMLFASPRRMWMEVAAARGVKSYGYLFAQPPSSGSDPSLGVAHGNDVFFVFGLLPNASSPRAKSVGMVIMDYWISFATSLDPNDGHGAKRPKWPCYTSSRQTLLQIHEANTTTIQDDFRKEQIAFFNSRTIVFRR